MLSNYAFVFTASKSKDLLSRINQLNLPRPPPLSSPISTPPHKRMRALQINTDLNIAQETAPSPIIKKISPRGSLFGGRRSSKTSPPSAKKSRPLFNPYTPDRQMKTAQKICKLRSRGLDMDRDRWVLCQLSVNNYLFIY